VAVTKIDIAEFLSMTGIPVIDVRSPQEYSHAHIPGAINMPLFNDEERKVVGTTYKQLSREQAIKIGLDYFGPKMRRMVEQIEGVAKEETAKRLVVHCWRGGMRSAAVAWLLDLYGFKIYTIIGGYKAFRNWAIQHLAQDRAYTILGGYTGSAKTEILRSLKEKGETVIDLEGIANHKGSAFGAIGQEPQPSQEMFENILATQIFFSEKKNIWLEDESQRIGLVNIPHLMWDVIRKKPVFFLDIPFDIRLDHIVKTYGGLNKGELAAAIIRIKKRLGGLETKNALAFLAEDNIRACFEILLTYYDKLYARALLNRPDPKPTTTKINPETFEFGSVAELILKKWNTHGR
jgi:tRNA 2-selenouridine synthase